MISSMDVIGGKVGFSHGGGLVALYLVADPEQPLDGNLRATCSAPTEARDSCTAAEVGEGHNRDGMEI